MEEEEDESIAPPPESSGNCDIEQIASSYKSFSLLSGRNCTIWLSLYAHAGVNLRFNTLASSTATISQPPLQLSVQKYGLFIE